MAKVQPFSIFFFKLLNNILILKNFYPCLIFLKQFFLLFRSWKSSWTLYEATTKLIPTNVECYRHNKAVYPLIFEYPMTSMMHKILFHGLLVVQNALLLIRQLSQEGTEARNKHIHSFRLHVRKSCQKILQHGWFATRAIGLNIKMLIIATDSNNWLLYIYFNYK